jgi:membrane-bound lytic murein transglycosylase D
MLKYRIQSRLLQSALFFAIALLLAGCFRSAGDAVEPTSVDLTSLAPTQPPATLFITPISTGGFPTTAPQVAPTDIPPTNDGLPTLEPPSVTPQPPVDASTVPAANIAPVNATTPTATTDVNAAAPSITPIVTSILVTPTALPSEDPCVHTVQPGEWLYSIARKYNVNPADLLAANPQFESNPDSLKIGDVLKIPNCPPAGSSGNAAAPAATNAPAQATNTPESVTAGGATQIPVIDRIYTVAAGDTLSGIARKFNTTVALIKEVNGLTSDALSIGQQLKIPAPQ